MARPPSRWAETGAELLERALRPTVVPNGNPDLPPSSVGEDVDEAGDSHSIDITGSGGSWRRTTILPSPWSGLPADWQPVFNQGRGGELVDTAWSAIDLNARVLATMPPYLLRGGEVQPGRSWVTNPDPDRYTGWTEFAKQYAWDFQLGEVFVLCTARFDDGWPARFHVVRPWLVQAEIIGGLRRYHIGALDVTADLLHVRYQSATDDARGHGPLEAGQSRIVAAGVLARYVTNLVAGGGVPPYVLKHPRALTATQADELLHNWFESRMNHLGLPGIMSGGLELETLNATTPRDLALVDIAQFNEARLAVLLGVPPFLLGLPSGGDSMTYSNVSSLFTYHWRAGLSTTAATLMEALSGWALPRGTTVELNRDEYVRPEFGERVTAYQVLHAIEDETGRGITAQEIRDVERLNGGVRAPALINGGN